MPQIRVHQSVLCHGNIASQQTLSFSTGSPPFQHGTQPAPALVPSTTSSSTELGGAQRVRRNLFTRSASMSATSSSHNRWWAKRQREEDPSMPAKKARGMVIPPTLCLCLLLLSRLRGFVPLQAFLSTLLSSRLRIKSRPATTGCRR